jgi:hypothetical protein
MDALELLRIQVRGAYEWLEITLNDITPEMVKWQPPGLANSIGVTYAHLVFTADFDVNSRFHGGMPVAATEFKGDIGLSELFPGGFGWEELSRRLQVDWPKLRKYGAAVHRSIEKRLEALSPRELDTPVDMSVHGLGMWTGLDIYNLHGIDHPRLHGGEIACLKGLQGVPGWQTGWRGDRSSETGDKRTLY